MKKESVKKNATFYIVASMNTFMILKSKQIKVN